MPVNVDGWGIDAIYSGSQKCLSCPPGLAPISFNKRAVDVILNRKTKVQSWYLDVSMLASYWGEDRVYFHDDQGRLKSLSAEWTSIGPDDSFKV